MVNDNQTHENVICLLPMTGGSEIYGYLGISVIALLVVYSITITIFFCLARKKQSSRKPESTVRPSELSRLCSDSKSSSTDREMKKVKEDKKVKKKKVEKRQCRISQSRNVQTETVDDVRSTWGPVQPEVM